MNTVKVEVLIPLFGKYKKGDVIEMEKSTALACQKNKAVKLVETKSKEK
jgi:hypothetical protein